MNSISRTVRKCGFLFDFQEAEKFKAMVDSLQKVLLQRCDKEGKNVEKYQFHLHSLRSVQRKVPCA